MDNGSSADVESEATARRSRKGVETTESCHAYLLMKASPIVMTAALISANEAAYTSSLRR
jgi:hypothetical protein